MSKWQRPVLLSLSGIFAGIGVLGGFDPRHFSTNFWFAGSLVVMFMSIPIVVVTVGLIGLEKHLGDYGRYVVTLICAAPGLFLLVMFLQVGGDGNYVSVALPCLLGWPALWFMTAPRASV